MEDQPDPAGVFPLGQAVVLRRGREEACPPGQVEGCLPDLAAGCPQDLVGDFRPDLAEAFPLVLEEACQPVQAEVYLLARVEDALPILPAITIEAIALLTRSLQNT